MPHFNDYSRALEEVFREMYGTSDRAAAIVAFAYLEETVSFALSELFADESELLIARNTGRINTVPGLAQLDFSSVNNLETVGAWSFPCQ